MVLDHDLGMRRVYKIWEEGKPPDFALEVISPSTRSRNEKEKVALYERLGIGEYFQFQPDPEKPEPRLVRGKYREVEAEPGRGLLSARLGVELQVEGKNLRVRDALMPGLVYSWNKEIPKNTAVAEARAEAEAEARRRSEARAVAAEARVAELEARLRQAGQ